MSNKNLKTHEKKILGYIAEFELKLYTVQDFKHFDDGINNLIHINNTLL